jgi:hypothetical protein
MSLLTLESLRKLIVKVIKEAKIKASPEYMAKEIVRNELQQLILRHVNSGDVTDEKQLKALLSNIDLSLVALKMIPFDVWKKLKTVK